MGFTHNDRRRPLSRTAAICRTLSILCKFAFFVIVLWSIFILVLMGFSLANASLDDKAIPFAIALPFLYALYGAVFCMVPWTLGNMLGELSTARTPFTIKNARRLRFMALVLVLYSVLESLLSFVDSEFALSIDDGQHIQVGNLVHDFAANAGTTLDLFPLVIAAVFFALSFVFQYGVLLQQQSDETL